MQPPAGLRDQPGGTRQAEAQAASRLAAAEEGIEQVGGVDGRNPLPESLKDQESSFPCTLDRNKDLAAGRRRLNRVSKQDLGEMPQRVGIDRARRRRLVDLAGETNAPGGAFLLKVAQARASRSAGRQGRGLGTGGRATNMRSRRIR